MDITTIEGLMKTAEDKFNNLNRFQEEVRTKLKELGLTSVAEVEAEMNRLQGDFRSLDAVRQQIGATASPAPVTDPATTVDATVTKEPSNAKRTKSKS